MKKLIVIDTCMRDAESRTRRILEPIVEELGKTYEIERVVLDGEDYAAVGRKVLAERNNGHVPAETVEMARRVAEADRLVIAAPFWDMSFPAILKVFIEQMSLFNITFKDNGSYFDGLCKCGKVLYITTRGMNVHTGEPLEAATPYIKAISALWGLGEVVTVAAENLDYSTPAEIDMKISQAIAEGLEICRTGF
ncbi:MAG: NAD(P)H-dependent oxidoreductase [Bacteroidales bacterium]|nr:NAD(P)H-dependent oxidoreductase [Bacteroidales bacterium]